MTVFELIENDLAHGRDLVGESERSAGRQEQVSVRVDTAAEVEVRAGEVIAVAIAKNAELKRWK